MNRVLAHCGARFPIVPGVRFVTTSAGSPTKLIAPLHDAGIVVYHAVPTLEAALKTQFTAALHDQGLMPPDTSKGIRSVYFDGDMDAAPALAGQSAGLIHAVKPVEAIIDDTVAEFLAISRRLGVLGAGGHFG